MTVLAWLAAVALRTSMLSAVAALALAAVPRSHALPRLRAWTVVLYAALAMPALALWLPPLPLRLPVLPAPAAVRIPAVAPTALPPAVRHASGIPPGGQPAAPAGRGATAAPPAASPRGNWHWLWIALYGGVLLVLLGRLLSGAALAARLLRGARPVPALGADVSESGAVVVPAAVGVLRPRVVLPLRWREWEPARLQAVLAHERAHLVRGDGLTQRLALLHRALFWFSPLAWWMHAHLVELAEQCSDEDVLRTGLEPADYAAMLLGFLGDRRRGGRRVRWHAVAMAHSSRAEQRLEKILQWKGGDPLTPGKSVSLALLLAVVPLALALGAARPKLVPRATPAAAASPRSTRTALAALVQQADAMLAQEYAQAARIQRLQGAPAGESNPEAIARFNSQRGETMMAMAMLYGRFVTWRHQVAAGDLESHLEAAQAGINEAALALQAQRIDPFAQPPIGAGDEAYVVKGLEQFDAQLHVLQDSLDPRAAQSPAMQAPQAPPAPPSPPTPPAPPAQAQAGAVLSPAASAFCAAGCSIYMSSGLGGPAFRVLDASGTDVTSQYLSLRTSAPLKTLPDLSSNQLAQYNDEGGVTAGRLPAGGFVLSGQATARAVYRALANIAGFTLQFDPDFDGSLVMTFDYSGFTLPRALDNLALVSGSRWTMLDSRTLQVSALPHGRRPYAEGIYAEYHAESGDVTRIRIFNAGFELSGRATAKEAFLDLARVAGYAVRFDPKFDGSAPLELDFRGFTLPEAFAAVAEASHSAWRMADAGTVVVTPRP